MAYDYPGVHEWLASADGRLFLDAERQAVSAELARMFGGQFLQVGRWGDPEAFLPIPGTAYRSMCDAADSKGIGFVARPERLSVSAHSVDALLLPHTVELSRDPHGVLREAERVLVGGGRLMVLGFSPVSLLGLQRLLTRGRRPPGLNHLFTSRRMRDWLSLLGFDVTIGRRYFPAFKGGGSMRKMTRSMRVTYGAYMMVAVKRVYTVTPLKRRWRAPAKVTGGLVEPSTRNPV